ncbi:MAG TPA: rRNA maturation RNase YbeY [Anaeromyxobacteraceae bacterium]|nr:rRNA maturation RNase YbeY [Anaeromyxobacteraceae bacterium]
MIVEARSEHARGAGALRRLRERARRHLSALGCRDAELSIVIVGDAAIRRLNRRFREVDRATDVLSFSQSQPSGSGQRGGRIPHLLGDVIISLETAERAARAHGGTVRQELDRYLAHGLLHLLGYDHEGRRAARRMALVESSLVGEGMLARAAVRVARSAPQPPRKAAR